MSAAALHIDAGAWPADPRRLSCSMATRGLEVYVRCIMRRAERVGYLELNGRPIEPSGLARLVGSSEREVAAWLAELLAVGIFEYDGEVLSCPDMIREAAIRAARAAGGRRGGNPELLRGKDNLPREESNANHAGEGSREVNVQQTFRTQPTERERQFLNFLNAWPTALDPEQRIAAARAWRQHVNGDAAAVLRAIEAEEISDAWRAGETPEPATWLAWRPWDSIGG